MVQVKIRNFEGPLDLLLKLVEEEKVDIISLPLSQIADQYWEHIESGRVDPDELSEYIVIGSRLLYAKSRAVIPGATHPASEPYGDKAASADLADTLAGYKKFKEAIQFFQELEDNGRRAYGRPSSFKADSLPLDSKVSPSTALSAPYRQRSLATRLMKKKLPLIWRPSPWKRKLKISRPP